MEEAHLEFCEICRAQGGVPGAANLGGCAALEAMVRRHAATGGLYAAICAAPPLALASWGMLNGLKVAKASKWSLQSTAHYCYSPLSQFTA
jgi:putative intracellular protease/amidase